MFYQNDEDLKVYYEVVEPTAIDAFVPLRVPSEMTVPAEVEKPEVETQEEVLEDPPLPNFNGLASTISDLSAASDPTTVRSHTTFVRRRPADEVRVRAKLGPVRKKTMVYIHSHGSLSILRVAVEGRKSVRVVGTLCYRMRHSDKETAVATFIDALTGVTSEAGQRTPAPDEASTDYVDPTLWVDHYVLASKIEVAEFCSNDEILITYNSHGFLTSWSLSESESDPSRLCVSVKAEGRPMDGPFGAIVGFPDTHYAVCCTELGSNFFVLDLRDCTCVKQIKGTNLSVVWSLSVTKIKSNEVNKDEKYAVFAAYNSATSTMLSVVRKAESNTIECTEISVPMRLMSGSLLPDSTLGDMREAYCQPHPILSHLVLYVYDKFFFLVDLSPGRKEEGNVLAVVANKVTTRLNRAEWLTSSVVSAKGDEPGDSVVSSTLIVTRADGISLIYGVVMFCDETSQTPTTKVRIAKDPLGIDRSIRSLQIEYLQQLTSQCMESLFFPLQRVVEEDTYYAFSEEKVVCIAPKNHTSRLSTTPAPTFILFWVNVEAGCWSGEEIPLNDPHPRGESSAFEAARPTSASQGKKITQMTVIRAESTMLISTNNAFRRNLHHNLHSPLRKKKTKKESTPPLTPLHGNSSTSTLRGQLVVVTTYSDGSSLLGLFGESEEPRQMTPARLESTLPAVTASHVVYSPDESRGETDGGIPFGCAYLINGNERGEVEIWADPCVLLQRFLIHNDAVVSIFTPPQRSSRTNIPFVSVSQDGSVALFKPSSCRPTSPRASAGTRGCVFEVFGIFHSPCHALTGVFWDSPREYCFMESAEGINIWHLITGKLERTVYVPSQPSALDDATTMICREARKKHNYMFAHHGSAFDESSVVASVERVQFATRSSHAVVIHLSSVLEHLLSSNIDESLEGGSPSSPQATAPVGPALPIDIRVALSFLFQGESNTCKEIAEIRDLLELSQAPIYPNVQKTSLQATFGTNSQRSAFSFITIISVLRALQLASPNVLGELAEAAIHHYVQDQSSRIYSTKQHLPCVISSIPLLNFNSACVQYAARQTINASIKHSSTRELHAMLGALHDLVSAPRSRNVGLTGLAIVALQTSQIKTRPESEDAADVAYIPTVDYVPFVARALVEFAVQTTKHQKTDLLLSLLGEGWPLFVQYQQEKHEDLLLHLFHTFADGFRESKLFRSSYGAKLIIQIVHHSPKIFFHFCEKIFSGQLVTPGEQTEARTIILFIFLRIIQTIPHRAVWYFTKMLGFVWKAVDPHTPNKAQRDGLLPIVALLFKNSVRYLPMVSFQQLNQRLAVGATDGTVTVYDVKSTGKIAVWSAHPEGVAAVTYSTVGHVIATMGMKLTSISIWRCESGGILSALIGSSSSNFKLVHSLNIVQPPDMVEEMSQLVNETLDCHDVVAQCRLTWISPQCLQLTTPWHEAEHYEI